MSQKQHRHRLAEASRQSAHDVRGISGTRGTLQYVDLKSKILGKVIWLSGSWWKIGRPESNLKVPEWGHWWVGEPQVWQGTLQCHSPLHDHFVCKSVFHRWCTLHKTGTFFHQLSVSESLLTTNMGSQCLAIFICSCANFNSSYHIQNEASCGFLFPLQISSNIVRIFYCFFTCNELIWTLDGNQITKMGIQDNALQWRANAKRNIEKYRSRNTGGAKVDKLEAQKWTNWRRNEMCCSCDLKWLAQVETVSRACTHDAEANDVCHVGGCNPFFQC